VAASDPIPTDGILASIEHAGFVWDIASDAMTWGAGAKAMLPEFPSDAIASGAEFAKRIEPQRSVRLDTITNSSATDQGDGVPYQIEYGVRLAASAPLVWIEETGRWFAGPGGKPARAHGVMRAINERHAREEQLLKLSELDPLTGELNRTRLIAALAEAIEEAQRFRTSFSFMVVAVDHLARVNDSFGFDVADEVIRELATRLRARLRGGDVLGRFSGNKLGLILKNCSVDQMKVAAERFLAALRDEVVPTKSGPVAVTVSVGGINVPRYARTADVLVSGAQVALY
jgi:diguanylate cyclase (GGDEF)-like protein